MLDTMFFYDGNLEDISPNELSGCEVIDAKEGYTANMKQLEKVLNHDKYKLVLTNQIAMLNMEWLWDRNLHRTKLFLKDPSDGKWKLAERFTKKQVKFNTNIQAFFCNGEFKRDRAFKNPFSKRRELVKFRL